MDGPKDYHTKWSKSDRERQISHEIACMWNLKKIPNTDELIYKTEIDSQTEKKLMVIKEESRGRGKLEVWNWNIHTQFSSVQSFSRVRLFVTPWIAARQASLSITNSQNSPKLMSIESVMPSSHLILLSPFLPATNPSQNKGLFHWVNSLHAVAKVLEFQL